MICPKVKKVILKENTNISLFYPKCPSRVEGYEIYILLSPYLTDATYKVWYRLAQ